MQEKVLLTFLLLCVLKGGFVSSLECPAEGISMSFEDDDNWEKVYKKVDSYKLCGIFCARSDICEFWTWYKEDSNSKKYDRLDCLLFSNNDQIQSNLGAYSGAKMCPEIEAEPDCDQCSPQPVRFLTKNLTKISFDDGQDNNALDKILDVGNSHLCGELCAITTPCIYWTWYKSHSGMFRDPKTCLMFNNIIQLQYNENAISGEKHYPNTDPEDTCPLLEDSCIDPCVIDPEPGPPNAGNVVPFGDECAMKVLGMAFYLAVTAFIRM